MPGTTYFSARGSATLLAIGFLLAPIGCGGDDSHSDGGGTGGNGWTVLVYMAADNNLEKFGLLDLNEMAGVGSSSGLNIIAQVDRSVGYTSDGVANLSDWTTTKRLQVGHGSLTEVSDLGVIDSADPAVLSDFIKWGVKTYPAGHYALVLWDHGGAWTGFGLDEDPTAGATQPDWMSLGKIATGVAGGLQAAGLSKFDVIGFDACMMATLEVAESLKAYGAYLLGSEETEPGHGWDYGALAGAASLDPVALSKKIIDGYQAQANSPDWGDGASITLSLIDLGKLGPIEKALGDLTGQYGTSAAMAPVSGEVGRERATALGFGRSPDPANDFYQVDMGDLFGKLAQPLGGPSSAISAAVGGAVVYQVKGSAYAAATGISLYFPPAPAYYKPAYDMLPGLDQWRPFVASYFGVATSGGATVPGFDIANSHFDAAATMTLDGALAAGALASATSAFLVYGLPGTGTDAYLLGQSQATPSNNSGTDHVIGSWNYSYLRLSQTVPTAHVEVGYLQVTANSTAATVSIPLSYYESSTAQPQIALCQIVVDLATGAISSNVTYLYSSSGQVGQLSPVAGSSYRALVAYLPDASQWAPQWVESTTSGAFDATQDISLDLPVLDSGTAFFAGLRIENAAGNGDWVTTPLSPTHQAMIGSRYALAFAALLLGCAASRVEPTPAQGAENPGASSQGSHLQPAAGMGAALTSADAQPHGAGTSGPLIGGRPMGEGVPLAPLAVGTSRSSVSGCLASTTQADGERFPPPPATRSPASPVTVTPFRGGVSVTHQLTHACCLKSQLTTRIEDATAVVLEKLTGSPCRCMCASTLRTAIGLAPGAWTVAVDLEQDGRVVRIAAPVVDVQKP